MSDHLWTFLPLGYALTVALELPVLLVFLDKRHPLRRKIFAGFWLTACTYPVVVIVLPQFFNLITQRTTYLFVAEIFAPLAEAALFLALCRQRPGSPQATRRDLLVVVLANVFSFAIGEVIHVCGWL